MINYEILNDILLKEKSSDKLLPLQENFIDELRQYFIELKNNMASVSSKEYYLIDDIMRNSRIIVESLCDVRQYKIINMAIYNVDEPFTKPIGLSSQEIITYETIVKGIREYRNNILSIIS
jgi:DNA replication initiation complex subunit (GINS family)